MSFSRSSSFRILSWDSSVPSSHHMSPMLTSAPAMLVSLCFLDTPGQHSCVGPLPGLCSPLGMFFPHMAVRLASSYYQVLAPRQPPPHQTRPCLAPYPALSLCRAHITLGTKKRCTFEGPVHHLYTVHCTSSVFSHWNAMMAPCVYLAHQ